VFLKSFQIDERWRFDDYSYLCKGLFVLLLFKNGMRQGTALSLQSLLLD